MPVINTKMYGGKYEMRFDALTHRYTVEGKKVPSVTTIIGETAPKPALMYWAVNCAADYWKENVLPGIRYDEVDIEQMWKDSKRAHTIKKEDAASIGSVTHRFVESYVKGQHPDFPVNEISRAACERFMKWVNDHKVMFLSAEQMIYSPSKGYCGQADFFCVIDGKLWLGDLKTSNAIYDEYLEQVCAYKQARNEEYPTEVFEGCVIVRVGKEAGEVEVKQVTEMEKYTNTFNARVELWKCMQISSPKK